MQLLRSTFVGAMVTVAGCTNAASSTAELRSQGSAATAAGTVSGFVHFDDGVAAESIEVGLINFNASPPVFLSAYTDAAGHYEITDVAAATYILLMSRADGVVCTEDPNFVVSEQGATPEPQQCRSTCQGTHVIKVKEDENRNQTADSYEPFVTDMNQVTLTASDASYTGEQIAPGEFVFRDVSCGNYLNGFEKAFAVNLNHPYVDCEVGTNIVVEDLEAISGTLSERSQARAALQATVSNHWCARIEHSYLPWIEN